MTSLFGYKDIKRYVSLQKVILKIDIDKVTFIVQFLLECKCYITWDIGTMQLRNIDPV